MQNIPIKSINYLNKKLVNVFYFFDKRRPIIFFLLAFSYLLIYFLQDFSSQSLIAHDEGLYARRSRLVEESSNWFSSPFSDPHHKTIGSYWFIALSIKFLGDSELALRLPSFFFSVLCLILTYHIALKITNKKSALISVFSLSSMPIWIQYTRYASPDFPFLFCILSIIFSFLQFLSSTENIRKYFYIFTSGLFIPIAFFIRSYMAFVPVFGLIPFLCFNLYRSKKIFSSFFFTGILFGSLPTFLNFYYSYKNFGIKGISILFDFAKKQAIGGDFFDNFLYLPFKYIYFTFPVGILFFILIVFTRNNNIIKYPLLSYYYPFSSLSILLCMSSSYPHYYLFLLPPLSILFSYRIQSFSFRFSFSKSYIKYLLIFLILILCCALVSLLFYYQDYLIDYSYRNTSIIYLPILLLFVMLLYSLKFLFESRYRPFDLLKFFFTIISSQYLSISILYNFGVIGNPNFQIKSFLSNSLVSSISNSNTIYLFNVDSKIETLLSYYLPSSKIIKSSNNIAMYNFIITSDKEFLYSVKNQSLYKSIKTFNSHYLLMKISK